MIVCADDFGLAPDINRAILDLADKGRLSAASCMVALPGFDRGDLDRLLRFQATLDIGIHLTLTDCPPAGVATPLSAAISTDGHLLPMGRLFRRGLVAAATAGAIAQEARAQYDRFVAYAGRPPDYIDSHLHTHQFPGVRDGILLFLKSLPRGEVGYVRNSGMGARKAIRQGVSPLKCLGIGTLGSAFGRRLRKAGIATNNGFSGIYAYDGHEAYPRYLERFVACMEGPRGILMTHPGEVEPWRAIEYRTLRQAACLEGRINRFGDAA